MMAIDILVTLFHACLDGSLLVVSMSFGFLLTSVCIYFLGCAYYTILLVLQ